MRKALKPWCRLGPLLLILLSTGTVSLAAGSKQTWVPSNSGMEGGFVPEVVVDPLLPSRIFVAAGLAGVFRSVDGAESWQNVGRPLIDAGRVESRSLVQDPFRESTIYAGTCRLFFRSPDAGDTWEGFSIEVEGGVPHCINAIAVDPGTDGTVYAATRSGFYRSRDRGATWAELARGSINDTPYLIRVDPSDSQVIYLALLFADAPLLRSLDGGETFRALDNGLGEGDRVSAIAIQPGQPTTVFVMHGFGVFRSRNRGDSWESVSPPQQNQDIFALGIHPLQPSTLLAGSVSAGVLISTDEGETWEHMQGSPLRIYSFAFDPLNQNLIYAGTAATGLWRSTDGGSTREPANSGLVNDPIDTVVPVDDQPARVYAGSFGGGIFRSDDSGRTWEPRNVGLTEDDIRILHANRSGETLLAFTRQALFVSQDGADSWVMATDPNPVRRENSIALADTEPPTFYAGSSVDGLFRSRDLGETWDPINQGLGNLQVETIIADRLNSARIFTGTVAGLFISTDGGDNWQAAGLTQVGVSDLEIDADNRDTFYAVDRLQVGIYRTSDGGANWEEIGQEISDQVTGFSIRLTAHPKLGGLLYVVSEVGTFKSRDRGETWKPAGLGLPSDEIRAVSFSPDEPATLFAGTALGVFRLDPQELYFPLLQGSASDFTAIAVTNDLIGPTLVELEVRDSLGFVKDYPENPNDMRLDTGKQVARLGAEFFGLGLEDERSGWVRLRAGWAELGSFFQFGSLDNPTVTRLDGSVAIREKSNTLYFNRIYDGPGTFPGLNGELDAETVLAVANPNQESILVSFSYFDGGARCVSRRSDASPRWAVSGRGSPKSSADLLCRKALSESWPQEPEQSASR